MAVRGKGGRFAAKVPPPAEPPLDIVPDPPPPRVADVDEGTKPPPGEGGGTTKEMQVADGQKVNWKKIVGGLAVIVGVFGIWKFWPWRSDEDPAPVAPIVQAGPATPATYTPPPQAPAPPAPAVAQPVPVAAQPAAPPPAPTMSAEEVEKKIAALTDGEVKACLQRLKGWGVDLSTLSAFDSEAKNCRDAVAAK